RPVDDGCSGVGRLEEPLDAPVVAEGQKRLVVGVPGRALPEAGAPEEEALLRQEDRGRAHPRSLREEVAQARLDFLGVVTDQREAVGDLLRELHALAPRVLLEETAGEARDGD